MATEEHIAPSIGGVQVAMLSSSLVREWRAKSLEIGVSVSMAAKAYRLFRAIMTTAVEEDGTLPKNPCRIKGADDEHAAERAVLTVAQVFDLADRVGMRPVGNIRKTPDGYRLKVRPEWHHAHVTGVLRHARRSRTRAVEDDRRRPRRLHA